MNKPVSKKSGICPVGLCNGGFGCQHTATNTVIIEINTLKEGNQTNVVSDYSAWDSLFIVLEGVAVLAKLAMKEGYSGEEISKKIKSQLSKALIDYDLIFTREL